MNASTPAEFKASGKFDDTRAELIQKYKQSEAMKKLDAAVRDHVARTIQTNPDLMRNSRQAVAELYRQVRQSMRMVTLAGTAETNEFVESELKLLEQTLTAAWEYPDIE